MPRVKTIRKATDRACVCFVNTKRRNVTLDTTKLPKRLIKQAMTWQHHRTRLVWKEDELGEAVVEHAHYLERVSSWLAIDDQFMASALRIARLNAEIGGLRDALRWIESEIPKKDLDRILAAIFDSNREWPAAA